MATSSNVGKIKTSFDGMIRNEIKDVVGTEIANIAGNIADIVKKTVCKMIKKEIDLAFEKHMPLKPNVVVDSSSDEAGEDSDEDREDEEEDEEEAEEAEEEDEDEADEAEEMGGDDAPSNSPLLSKDDRKAQEVNYPSPHITSFLLQESYLISILHKGRRSGRERKSPQKAKKVQTFHMSLHLFVIFDNSSSCFDRPKNNNGFKICQGIFIWQIDMTSFYIFL